MASATYERVPCELKTCILSRLAVKDLLRFRCVSKPWRALIDDPFFVKKHLQRSIHESEHTDNPSILLLCTSCERVSITKDLYKVDLFLGMEKCKIVKMADHTLPISSAYYTIGACDGLLCLSRVVCCAVVISIWNLSTRESHDLPLMPNQYHGSRVKHVYGFGYDRISDDYKVIHIVRSNISKIKADIRVYSVKRKSWTEISSIDPSPYREFMMVEDYDGTFARSTNSIYWVFKFRHRKDPTNPFLIGGFDLGDGNRYSEVEQPNYSNNNEEMSDISIGALGGCLCLHSRYLSSNDIWVMKEDNKSWTKLISFSSNFGGWYRPTLPLVYSRSGNKILLKDLYSCNLTWYDLKTKKHNHHGMLMYKREIVMTESLVRINNGT